jgi:outer membrane protein insertion porin family
VRRLNQLGFFEPLDEEQAIGIEKTDDADNEVDLTIDLTETNLNQLTFGAGVSQYDGFFGTVSFQTSNFLGRGETLGVGVQSGSRVRDINVTFTEPYLFDRNMSGSIGVFSRKIDWIGAYTEGSTGGTATVGVPLALFTRLFMSYSYEATSVGEVSPYFTNDPDYLQYNPFFADLLLLDSDGHRTVSKVTPMISMNTVDHPIFPRRGTRYQAGVDLAGLGGNSKFWKPVLEGIWYLPQTERTTIGLRAQYQYLAAATPDQIPIFERLWLGGEYSVRGYDIRRIGPTLSDVDSSVSADEFQGRYVIGGNKSLLFNAEYQFSIADPVRIVAFYDAGQVQNFGQDFAMDGFRTSTGVELRFFIPMLNVPFRLIYAWNPQYESVYNDRYQPQEETVFRFAVGTTF